MLQKWHAGNEHPTDIMTSKRVDYQGMPRAFGVVEIA
jgi:hypothetical protein